MNAPLLNTLIYLLGFVGLAAIGLLLFRSWQVLRSVLRSDGSRRTGKPLVVFAVLITTAALWSDVQITIRIFRCLTEHYCGPNVASGWVYLAMLGVVYLVFEAVILAMQKIGRIRTI